MRAVLALTLAVGLADQTPPPVESRLVYIDAVAADARGRVVDDLRAGDFEVLDEAGVESLESVRFVRADGAAPAGESLRPILSRADEQAEAAREGTRLFAIYLDEYHVASGPAVARAREALTGFVQQQLGPRDLLLVLKPLDSLLNLRLTRDREAAASAINAFEGRRGDLAPRNAFEKNYIAGNPARVEAIRAQIATSALNAIATHLGGLGAARKTLIVVSEGFPRSQRRRGDEPLPTVDTIIRSANKANVSLYPIDPRAFAGASDSSRGPSGPSADERQGENALEVLRAMADETGGQTILAPADLAAGLRRIVSDSSTYYLLGVESTREADGKFRPLEVRVKRAGIQLRTRKGYWALAPDDLWRARLANSGTYPPPAPQWTRHISPLIRPWFGMAPATNGRTRVSFVWEPAGRVPGDRIATPAPARVVLKATQADGTAVFEGSVRAAGPIADPYGDEPASAVFETVPGRLRVQMSIEDAGSRIVDTDVREVTLRAFNGPVALGSAQVLRARNAREYRALIGDAEAAPVAAREFSRTERLVIRVPVYAVEPPAVVSARLVSKLGGSMRDLSAAATAQPDIYQIDLPLAGLAAGEYVVDLTATTASGKAADTLAFRVTP